MKTTLAFDVYGTLTDTAGVVTALEELAGTRAAGRTVTCCGSPVAS